MNPTIISNNCIAGIIYHDLNLRFLSPTINLFLDKEDYLEFLEHFEYYINEVPQEIINDNIPYPQGILRRGDRIITLNFMHYDSFDNAKEKWTERVTRINCNNIYVLFELPYSIKEDDIAVRRFLKLNFKHKMILTSYKGKKFGKEVAHLDVYDKNYYSGKTLAYRCKLGVRRYLDDFDYVSFLNEQ